MSKTISEQIDFNFCKTILTETIDIVKDEGYEKIFRDELKANLLELKDEIDKIILENS